MLSDLYVISDLHLGGRDTFRMCSAASRAKLVAFFEWLSHTPGDDRRLIINGDFVDFLAETPWEVFTGNEAQALTKLESIMDSCKEVWNALRALVQSGVSLILMLGNHDVELALPKPRRRLIEAIGPGKIEFLYDNEAYAVGHVLIEHGNRYDMWNAIPHDAFRKYRSQVSRGMTPAPLNVVPGSELVVSVMNTIKGEFQFVDLLKPEDAGVLPLLAALRPSLLPKIRSIMRMYRKAKELSYTDRGQPIDPEYIAATTANDEDEQLFALAQDLAAGGDATTIAAGDWEGILGWLAAGGRELGRRTVIDVLYRALRALAEHHACAFDVTKEKAEYKRAAETSAALGFRVVVYGHTHLPKRIELDGGGLYLNTGTWADLMRLPEGVLVNDEASAKEELSLFLEDLRAGRLAKWRRTVPTFAHIRTDADLAEAKLFFFNGEAREPTLVTTEELAERLAPGESEGAL